MSRRLVTAHTAELDADTLGAAKTLLEGAFGDDWTDEDWEHSLGGLHALVWDGSELIGHGALVQRRLLLGERALRTGYVEGVAVRGDQRRRGHGSALMGALEQAIPRAYELGALSASDPAAHLYVAHGWRRWRGRTFALTPTGVQRTEEDDGGIYVYPPTLQLDLGGDLTCDWRAGDLW